MKHICLIFSLFLLLTSSIKAAPGDTHIVIQTRQTALVIRVDTGQLPTIVHLGTRLRNVAEYAAIPGNGKRGEDYTGIYNSVYTPAGGRNLLEPAIQVTHADGNASLDLKYIRHETSPEANGAILTKVYLKDPQYAFEVTLYYKAYQNDDVIEQWSTIRHTEKKAVTLHKYASANLYIPAQNYYLTHFHGDWASEMNPSETMLTEGIKVLDSKLGTRADLFQPPSFLVALNQPAEEEQGEVIAGTLAWSGNYQLAFEVDPLHNLRIHSRHQSLRIGVHAGSQHGVYHPSVHLHVFD